MNLADKTKRTEELEPVAQHILDAIEPLLLASTSDNSDDLKKVILNTLVKEEIDARDRTA